MMFVENAGAGGGALRKTSRKDILEEEDDEIS
jgi:hypothetical protein